MSWRQSLYWEIPYLEVKNYETDIFLYSLLPIDYWNALVCMPIDECCGTITIASAEPNELLANTLSNMLRRKVLFFRASQEDILEMIEDYTRKKKINDSTWRD